MGAARAIPELRPATRQAIGAVTRALALAGQRAGARDITVKSGRDLVTATDVAVEDAVRHLLADGLGLPVVGEERGGEPPADGAAYWLVDPICGTRNFASGTPLYCVNVALVERGEVTAAIVGDPSTGEVAVAERGRGAWALGDGGPRRLAVAADSHTIVVEDGKSAGPRREHAARFTAEAIRADRWDFRALGTTLALPYVAAGRVSAYVVFMVGSTHTAPGSLLVAEAGGRVSDIAGRPWTIRSDSIVASAGGDLHGELLRLARATTLEPS